MQLTPPFRQGQRHFLITACTSFLSFGATGQSNSFLENKGQVLDQYGQRNSSVQFILSRPGLNLHLLGQGFSYERYQAEEIVSMQHPSMEDLELEGPRRTMDERTPIIWRTHRVDVEFIGATAGTLIPSGRSRESRHYYSHATDHSGATQVRQFDQVMYPGIYPNIDLVFTLNEHGGPKYDLIVHPGGDAGNIRVKFTGMEQLRVSPEEIQLTTRHGVIRESIPASFLADDRQAVEVRYTQHNDGSIGFLVPTYPKDRTLVIDPFPVWGTYFGSDGWDKSYAIATDEEGFVIAGESRSLANMATSGSFQNEIVGNTDAFIARFTEAGELLWCTYFGGLADDMAHGVAMRNDAIYVTGQTYSSDLPVSPGSHQGTYGGHGDAFLASFSIDGTLNWSSYYGGSDVDVAHGVATTNAQVYITGRTRSNSGIATADAQQEVRGGGSDMFLAAFDTWGVRQWGTYHGGAALDIGHGIAADDNSVYVAGWSGSSSGVATPGSHQSFYMAGSWDAFLVKYARNGELQWGSYYGGVNGDQGYCVAIGTDGVYLGGATESTQGMSTPGAYQPANGGGGWDGFLAKFNTGGARLWGTLYGGFDTDLLNGVVATAEGVHVTGTTSSVYVLGSPGTHQPAFTGGHADAFVARFTPEGQRVWGTYYGGLIGDYGLAIAANSTGVHVSGFTASTTGIAYNSPHQATIAQEVDAFVVKFPYSAVGILAPIRNTLGFSVYPIPAQDHIIISCSSKERSSIRVQLCDLLGRSVFAHEVPVNDGLARLELSGVSSGNYMLTISSNEGFWNQRITVAH